MDMPTTEENLAIQEIKRLNKQNAELLVQHEMDQITIAMQREWIKILTGGQDEDSHG